MPLRSAARRLALVAVLAAAASPTWAQWVSTGGPPGGRFSYLAAPDGALLGTSPYASLRYHGDAWASLPLPLYFPVAQGARVMAVSADSVVHSTDGGATFARLPGSAQGWRPLGFDGDALFLTDADSLRVTHDGGATWRAVQDSIWVHVVFGGSTMSFPVVLHSMEGALADGDAVLVAATAYVFGGVYRHAPGDTAWVPLFQPGDGTFQNAVRPGSLVRFEGAIWFGHSGGVHRSADGGATWEDVSAGLPDASSGVALLPGAIGLVAAVPGGALFRWDGAAWAALPAPPTAAFTLAAGDELYGAALDHTYAFDGAAWHALPDVVASSPVPVAADAAAGAPGALLATSSGLLLRSTDGGTAWTTSLTGAIGPFALRPGEILAGTTAGFRRSTDGGLSWTPTAQPVLPPTAPTQRPVALAVHDGAHYALYGYARSGKHGVLLEEYSGAFRSADAGATWTPVFDGLPFGTVGRSPITAGAAFDGVLFAVTRVGCIALPDGASAWSPRACPPGSLFGEAAEAEGRWLVRTSDGVFTSADGGASWTPATAGLPVPAGSSEAFRFWSGARFARTTAGLLLAADPGDGFRFFRFDGTAWTATPATFPPGVAWGGFLEAAGGTLYGGSMGRGLWRTTLDVVTAADGPGAAPVLALDAPAPNPARGTVRLRFTLPAAADVTLAVYDALGRRVAVLADGPLAAGPHEAAWAARGAAAGTYVVRLTTPDGSLVRRVAVLR